MAEYDSFHYLMHKVPEAQKPVYVTGPKALTFAELYSPRESAKLVGNIEKSYWRTRERIEYNFWEYREQKSFIITCRNIDSNEVFRTIFLDIEALYFEIESKARGNRESITKKKDKKLPEDAELHKATIDYLQSRLNIKSEPLQWPTFFIPSQSSDIAVTSQSQILEKASERMCTFDKLSGDVYDCMEINYDPAISIDGIPFTKITPTVPTALMILPPDLSAQNNSDVNTSATVAVSVSKSVVDDSETVDSTDAQSAKKMISDETTFNKSRNSDLNKSAATTMKKKPTVKTMSVVSSSKKVIPSNLK